MVLTSNTDTQLVTILNVAPTVDRRAGRRQPMRVTTHGYSYTTSDPGVDTFAVVSSSCGANGTLSNASFNAATGAGSFDCTFPDGDDTSIGVGPS